jgi:uncharacterized protein YkwD
MLRMIQSGVRRRPVFALVVIAVVVMTALTTAAVLAAPPGEPISQIERELVEAVNSERAKVGAKPLIVNYSLMEAAYKHNEHMADVQTLAHEGIGDGDPFERIRATGYKYADGGENVALGQPSVVVVMDSWMHSAGHRRNILKAGYTDIGVAYTPRGGHYWTQVFGVPKAPPEYVTVTPPPGANRPCDLEADFDYDGFISKADVNIVARRFMMKTTHPDWKDKFDVVPDGVINVYDVFEMVARLGTTCKR